VLVKLLRPRGEISRFSRPVEAGQSWSSANLAPGRLRKTYMRCASGPRSALLT